MRKILFVILILICAVNNGFAQYWQQEVNYNIQVTLNDKDHTLNGTTNITYKNNSPDKLDFIWFHLWPNAYQSETSAYARQIFRDPEGKKRWKEMKDRGSIEGIDFTVNGEKAKTEADPDNSDIIKLVLPKPLQPGETATISTAFLVRIPTYSSRSGHLGQSYMICQWYPKPAVYDRKGWHAMPYLDQGEFYSEFGSFDVSITVPSQYVIGATGILQNTDELNKYRELGTANNTRAKDALHYTPLASTGTKTLQFKGEQIHDFAWFADKDFIIRYDTARLASGKVIDVFTYGHKKGNKNWQNSVSYVEDAVRRYSSWIGEYPYPVVQAVEGPKNVMSGGMEYPMITLITSPNAEEPQLDAVIAHEVGHNWFYGIIATNERDHPWMDEGINTYYQFQYEAEKYRSNMVFGNMIPEEIRKRPLPEFRQTLYVALSQLPMEKPIETPSAEFGDKNSYGVVVYVKAAVWMFLVESSIGEHNLKKAMQSYYNEWKFKHPYPEDLKAVFEKELNMKFDDIFNLLKKPGKFD